MKHKSKPQQSRGRDLKQKMIDSAKKGEQVRRRTSGSDEIEPQKGAARQSKSQKEG